MIGLGMTMFVRAQPGPRRFVPSADGLTVHDTLLRVTWIADANLPATQPFGLPIQKSGAMTDATARKWVAALNAGGYLGHTNWTLPLRDGVCAGRRGGR